MTDFTSNIKIFVCTHKPVENIPNDEVYTPIHLGRIDSPYKEDMTDIIGDDTGDNISERGEHYSEGTAMYWIWKNVHDCKYVGIAQYRRRFAEKFTNENIEQFFKDGTDVILSKHYFRRLTRYHTVVTYLQMEDFLILKGVMKKLYPEYLPTLISFLHDYRDHPFNLMVCKKELFDKYAEFAFNICFEMEKYVRYSPYFNGKRIFGYVLELLTPIFFIHNKCKIKQMDVSFCGNTLTMPFRLRFLMFISHHIMWRRTKKHNLLLDPSFIRGLGFDKIDLDFY